MYDTGNIPGFGKILNMKGELGVAARVSTLPTAPSTRT
jgi:hypothetical protein